jgi:hypothetical protein
MWGKYDSLIYSSRFNRNCTLDVQPQQTKEDFCLPICCDTCSSGKDVEVHSQAAHIHSTHTQTVMKTNSQKIEKFSWGLVMDFQQEPHLPVMKITGSHT